MDVDRVSAKSHQSTESHPVLRTLYDHTDVRTHALDMYCMGAVRLSLVHTYVVTYVPAVCMCLLQGVISLDFHPTAPILASGSKDCTVKFFHHSKPAVKRASCFIQVRETHVQTTTS